MASSSLGRSRMERYMHPRPRALTVRSLDPSGRVFMARPSHVRVRRGNGGSRSRARTSRFTGLPRALPAKRPAVDPVVTVVRAALHLEAVVADVHPEEERIRARREVRLEGDLAVVDEQVALQPE